MNRSGSRMGCDSDGSAFGECAMVQHDGVGKKVENISNGWWHTCSVPHPCRGGSSRRNTHRPICGAKPKHTLSSGHQFQRRNLRWPRRSSDSEANRGSSLHHWVEPRGHFNHLCVHQFHSSAQNDRGRASHRRWRSSWRRGLCTVGWWWET